jgi:hypothetical protein
MSCRLSSRQEKRKKKYFENFVEAVLERILECVMYSVKGPEGTQDSIPNNLNEMILISSLSKVALNFGKDNIA